METVFTFGGTGAMIELRQSDNKQARFILTYGCEVHPGLTYATACCKLGEAILHHLSCEGIVNNDGV